MNVTQQGQGNEKDDAPPVAPATGRGAAVDPRPPQGTRSTSARDVHALRHLIKFKEPGRLGGTGQPATSTHGRQTKPPLQVAPLLTGTTSSVPSAHLRDPRLDTDTHDDVDPWNKENGETNDEGPDTSSRRPVQGGLLAFITPSMLHKLRNYFFHPELLHLRVGVEKDYRDSDPGEHETDAASQASSESTSSESKHEESASLPFPMFLEAFKRVFGSLRARDKDELRLLFMKIDANCDGAVDWSELTDFLIAIEQSKAEIVSEALNAVFQPLPNLVQCSHRGAITSISLISGSASAYYVTAARDGVLQVFNSDTLKLLRVFRHMETEKEAEMRSVLNRRIAVKYYHKRAKKVLRDRGQEAHDKTIQMYDQVLQRLQQAELVCQDDEPSGGDFEQSTPPVSDPTPRHTHADAQNHATTDGQIWITDTSVNNALNRIAVASSNRTIALYDPFSASTEPVGRIRGGKMAKRSKKPSAEDKHVSVSAEVEEVHRMSSIASSMLSQQRMASNLASKRMSQHRMGSNLMASRAVVKRRRRIQAKYRYLESEPSVVWFSPLEDGLHILCWGENNGAIHVVVHNRETRFEDGKHPAMAVGVERAGLIHAHCDRIEALEGVKDLQVLVSASADSKIYFHDLEKICPIRVFNAHPNAVYDFAWCRSSKFMVSAGQSRLVYVWNPWSGSIPCCAHGVVNPRIACIYCKEIRSEELRTKSARRSEGTTAAKSRRSNDARNVKNQSVVMATLGGHRAPITHMLVDARHHRLVSFDMNKNILCWDLGTLSCTQTIRDPALLKLEDPFTAVAFDAERHVLMVAGNHLTAWRLLPSSEMLAQYDDDVEKGNDDPVSHGHAIVLARYNDTLGQVVSSDVCGVVNVWSSETGKHLFRFTNPHGDTKVSGMCFDATKRRLITGGHDGATRIWNYNKGEILQTCSPYPAKVGLEGVEDEENSNDVHAGAAPAQPDPHTLLDDTAVGARRGENRPAEHTRGDSHAPTRPAVDAPSPSGVPHRTFQTTLHDSKPSHAHQRSYSDAHRHQTAKEKHRQTTSPSRNKGLVAQSHPVAGPRPLDRNAGTAIPPRVKPRARWTTNGKQPIPSERSLLADCRKLPRDGQGSDVGADTTAVEIVAVESIFEQGGSEDISNRYVMTADIDRRLAVYIDVPGSSKDLVHPWKVFFGTKAMCHTDDVTQLLHCPPTLVASGGFDGRVILWTFSTASPRIMCDARCPENVDLVCRFLGYHLDILIRKRNPKKRSESTTERTFRTPCLFPRKPMQQTHTLAAPNSETNSLLPTCGDRRARAASALRSGKSTVDQPAASDEEGRSDEQGSTDSDSDSDESNVGLSRVDAGKRPVAGGGRHDQKSLRFFEVPEAEEGMLSALQSKLSHATQVLGSPSSRRDQEDREETRTIDPEAETQAKMLCTKQASVECMAVYPKLSVIAASGSDGILRFWNIATGSLIYAAPAGHPKSCAITALAPDTSDNHLVSACASGFLKVWHLGTKALSRNLKARTNSGIDVFSIMSRNVPPVFEIGGWQAHQDSVAAVEIMEKEMESYILSAGSDGMLSIWSMNGSKVGTFGQRRPWSLGDSTTWASRNDKLPQLKLEDDESIELQTSPDQGLHFKHTTSQTTGREEASSARLEELRTTQTRMRDRIKREVVARSKMMRTQGFASTRRDLRASLTPAELRWEDHFHQERAEAVPQASSVEAKVHHLRQANNCHGHALQLDSSTPSAVGDLTASVKSCIDRLKSEGKRMRQLAEGSMHDM